jgi:hypothetical protein
VYWHLPPPSAISSPSLDLQLSIITFWYKLSTSTLVVETLGEHVDVLIAQRLLILRFLAVEEHIRIASPTFTDVFLGFLNLRTTEANPHHELEGLRVSAPILRIRR